MVHGEPTVAREAGLAHRLAIAKRFAELAAVGQAVFLTGSPVELELPHTVQDGERSAFTGFNRWMLLQVMQDQGWRDPRFFTEPQVRAAGWRVSADARPVVLQQVDATDAAGMVLPVPSVARVPVFNAEHVEGVPGPTNAPKRPVAALREVLSSEGFDPSAGVVPALAAWLDDGYPGQGGGHAAAGQLLARALAMTAIAAGVDWSDGHGQREASAVQGEVAHWAGGGWGDEIAALLADEPMAFFEAVRVADATVAHAMSLIRIAEQELRAKREVDMARGEDEIEEQRPQDAGSSEVTMAGSEERPMRSAAAPRPRSTQSYAARVEEMFADREAVLAVPFRDKDRAHALGAVWYKPQMVWFVPNGLDPALFKEWDPREHCLGQTAATAEVIDHFRKAAEDLGLDVSKGINADGAWHNVPVVANKGANRSGAYLLDLDGGDGPRGFINNKFSGEEMSWAFDGPLLTPEQKARMREEALRRAREADEATKAGQAAAAEHAAEILAQAVPADGHPYLRRKGVPAEGVLQVRGSVLRGYDEFYGETGRSAIREDQWYLIVPMRNMAGQLRAVQAISEDGAIKSFMRGAQKKGTMAVLGAPSFDALCASATSGSPCAPAVGFVEGFATGASFRQPTGLPVIVCFDAGNLEAVVAEAAGKLPAALVPVIGVDNDQFFVERALGFLAEHVGVNPNSQRGSVVEVLSGGSNSRLVSLGDAVADGEWHQAPRGRYRMSVEREPDSTEVRQIALEAHQEGAARPYRMTFNNRGLEAGRVAIRAFGGGRSKGGEPTASRAVVLVPEFKDFNRRPTDWNDLATIEGHYAVARQVLRPLGLESGRRPTAPALEPRPVARSADRMER